MKSITMLFKYFILPDNTYRQFIIRNNQLMLHKDKTSLNSVNFAELRNTMCTQNAEFPNSEVGCTYS
jgi:hypothetical protein